MSISILHALHKKLKGVIAEKTAVKDIHLKHGLDSTAEYCSNATGRPRLTAKHCAGFIQKGFAVLVLAICCLVLSDNCHWQIHTLL